MVRRFFRWVKSLLGEEEPFDATLNAFTAMSDSLDTVYTHRISSPEIQKIRMEMHRTAYQIERLKQKSKRLGIWAAVFFLIGLIPISLFLLGIALIRYSKYREKQEKWRSLLLQYQWMSGEHPNGDQRKIQVEKRILQTAMRYKGRIYPEYLVIDCDLSLADSEKFLQQCVSHRIAFPEVDENGRIYYYFPTFDEDNLRILSAS